MTKIKKRPKVLLVGRTNVGKSTIFNRILGKTASIVFDQEGVTRDYISEEITWDDKTFNLIDTGGLSFSKKTTHDADTKLFQEYIQENVLKILEEAAVILFVCDGKNGLTAEDEQVAKVLHKLKNIPIILLVNKADNVNLFQEHAHVFNRLGFSKKIEVSALHGTGINTMLDEVVFLLGTTGIPTQEIAEPEFKVAIVGRPNVGKSSLMNLLTKQDRSIVSDIPGTTREAVSEKIVFDSNVIQLTDTAGVRRQSRVNEDLETLMVKSSLSTMRTADLIILVIDASEGKINDQELKLLFYAIEQHKPALILFNKADLLAVDDYAQQLLKKSIDEYTFVLKKFQTLSISCLTKKNIGRILAAIYELAQRCAQQFDPIELDELVTQAFQKKPMYHKRMQIKLMRVKQISGTVPTFILYSNYPQWFETSQLGFVENILRKAYDLRGCPIKFFPRSV